MTIDLQLHICRSGRPTPARGRLVLILLTACLAGFLTAGCAAPRLEDAGPSPTPQPAPTAMPTATPSPTAVPTMVPTVVATPTAAPTAAYQPDMAMFATVWQTVNDEFFDPAMNGVDWQAMREEYEPLVAGATDAESYYRLLNAMLFELGVSHLGALPAEMSSQLDPLTFAQGDLGFDVRFLDNAIVVTLVEPGSPAARAGFKPGFVITEIGGKTPDELDQESIMPPLNERDQRGRIAQLVRAQALGEPGQTVTVRYLDAKDQLGDITLTFAARDARETEVMPDLPPAYVTLDVRRLAPAIGYIRFSGFLSGIEEDVSAAIDEMADTRALIIDLRGNPGGVFPVRKALAEKLVGERVAFWRYKLRDDLDTIYLDPQPDAYQGDVVILIDELSASSAEEFAGGLQDIGRATIVGNRSPGRCLIANVVPLTDGAVLVYPHGQSQTASGAILEYYGVTPDVEVALDRASLLAGRDPQLEAALAVAAGQ